MPLLSAFTPCGQLEFSSDPSEGEKVYQSMLALWTDPKRGSQVLDMSEGTHAEAKLYATSMCLGDVNVTLRRANANLAPGSAYEMLPSWEAKYSIPPRPGDSIVTRRARAAGRAELNRGSRPEAMTDGLSRILGDAFIAYRAVALGEQTIWPADPSTSPGVFGRGELPPKIVRLLDPIAPLTPGASVTVAYENWCGSDSPAELLIGDVLCVQGENLGLAERITVTAVNNAASPKTFTAAFEKSHDELASATTGPLPLLWSTKRFAFIVVDADVALDPDIVAQVDDFMARHVRSVSGWGVVQPTTDGAATIGPFTLGVSPLGAVPFGTIDIAAPRRPGPIISALTPDHGTSSGGTVVVMIGGYFDLASTVTVGGIPVAFSVDSDLQITFTTPTAEVLGSVDVVVETPSGSFTLPNGFAYDEEPLLVTGFSPSHGNPGDTILAIGTGFLTVTILSQNLVAITPFTIVDDSTISFVAPGNGGPGDVSIVATAPPHSSGGTFHYDS